jgi:hypothetical protein
MGHREDGIFCGCWGPCPECSPRPRTSWLKRLIFSLKLRYRFRFRKYRSPVIKGVYPTLVAKDIISVQPMSGPPSVVFYTDYTIEGR